MDNKTITELLEANKKLMITNARIARENKIMYHAIAQQQTREIDLTSIAESFEANEAELQRVCDEAAKLAAEHVAQIAALKSENKALEAANKELQDQYDYGYNKEIYPLTLEMEKLQQVHDEDAKVAAELAAKLHDENAALQSKVAALQIEVATVENETVAMAPVSAEPIVVTTEMRMEKIKELCRSRGIEAKIDQRYKKYWVAAAAEYNAALNMVSQAKEPNSE